MSSRKKNKENENLHIYHHDTTYYILLIYKTIKTMKRKLQLKSILLTAALFVGTSAWATTYSGTVNFEAKSRSSYADGTFTTASNAGNGYALAVADLSGLENIASATSITLEFDVTVSGRLLIGIGDKNTRGTNANGSNKSTYNTEGLVMRYGTSDGSTARVNGGTNNANLLGKSSHVTFTLNRTTGKYSYTITYVDGNSETQTGLSASDVTTTVSNATIVEAYSWNNSQSNALSAVSYSYEYSASSFDYTVKAVNSLGTELQTFASGTSTEAVTVSYPRAIKVGEVWYTCPSTNNFSIEASSITPNPTITYTADESIIHFMEAEAITSSQVVESASCSGGKYVNYYGGPKSFSFVEAGKYELETNVASRNANSSLEVYTGDGTESVAKIAKNGSLGIRTCQFNVEANSTMRVGGPYYSDKFQNSLGFDYILIRKVNTPIDIKTTGTTFSSAFPIDCDNLPSGVTAYKVTNMTASQVTAVEVTGKVAANTGLILKATATGNFDIPVAATGEAIDGNLLQAAVTATTVTAGQAYGLSDGVFKKLQAGDVPAGKAYLLASSITSAPELNIDFGGTTAISEIKKMRNVENETFFDLQGRKVAQPTKGLYIVNGKKVIIK
jgi:hypothetical protein